MQKPSLNWMALVCGLFAASMPTTALANNAEPSKSETTMVSNQLELEECFVPFIRSKAKCGTLDVAENRALPMSETNKISLNVVLLPKFKEESNEYPLLFLAGGPGQAATELAPFINRSLNDVRQHHDLLFIDQRGTGQSSALVCDDITIDGLTYNDDNLDMKSEVAKCLGAFKDVHLPSYNTYDSIKDFEAVRVALGHKKLHILGGSYGTRAGFAYLKLFPESIETAILDSNAPMDLVIGLFGKTSERAFDMLLSDCERTESCKKAFPNLKQDYLTLMERLERGAIETETDHPFTGEHITAILTKRKVTEAVRSNLYNLKTRQMLPYMIHKAANRDYRFLHALIGRSGDSERGPGALYTGLTMNIVCNEDTPRATEQDFKADSSNYFNQELGNSGFREVCAHWPKWPAPSDFAEPVKTDVPVLLFSGSYDPVTPPEYGEMALPHLSNAKHVEIKHGSHVASLRRCPGLIGDFLEKKSLEDLDFSCAEKPVPMMFFNSINELR